MSSRVNTAVGNSMATPVLQPPDSPDSGHRRERAAIAAQACQTCRNRKSKCDEQRPKCGLCRRLNVECQYREPQPTKKDKTMVHILETLQRLENKFDNISLSSTTSPPNFRDTVMSTSTDQPNQQQSSTTSSIFNPSHRAISEGENKPGNMSRAEPYFERELQRSYHHLTAAHKIILWPAVYLHITNSNLHIAEDLQYVLQDGTPWLIHLELQKHKDPLPGPTQMYDMVSSPNNSEPTARAGFAGLTLDHMQRLIDAYFNTFNVIHPILDHDTFIADVVTPVVRNGYAAGSVNACLTLLVLALGQVAIDGVYGSPLANSPGGEPGGLRGGTRDHPPGLEIFNEARRLIGFSITQCSLENVQIYLLQGTYYEACARHLDFWRSCISASMAIQVLIRCGPVDWSIPKADPIKRAYWTCILDEDLYHLELDLPQTGIQTMEDQVPLPYFHEPRGDNSSVSDEKSHYQYHFLAMIALRRLIARIHQSIHGNTTGRAESSEDYGGPPLHVIRELARQLESWRSLLPQPLQWSDNERHDFPNMNPMSRRPADSLFAMDQGPVPINHRFNLDIITGQLRTRFYYAKFMIYRPFVYKALHFPELMTVDDANYCALAMQSACMWPLSMAPPKNKKRLVPHLFTWTQNFVGILLLLRMTTENDCLRQICNEKVSRHDMEQTVSLLLDWLRDMKQLDGIAEWSWKILEPLYANGF